MQVLNLTRLPRASTIRYFSDRLLAGGGYYYGGLADNEALRPQ